MAFKEKDMNDDVGIVSSGCKQYSKILMHRGVRHQLIYILAPVNIYFEDKTTVYVKYNIQVSLCI